YLTPAEREQLPCEAGASVSGRVDLREHLGVLEIGYRRLQRMRISTDDLKQVVEVVGHASRKPADGLHLLCLPQLQLKQTAFGDVRVDARDEVSAPCLRHR